MSDDWEDHKQRLDFTGRVGDLLIEDGDKVAADLSCGDGLWSKRYSDRQWHLGDYAAIDFSQLPRAYPYIGPIEETVELIPLVDIFFCCETIEHLDDPDYVLQRIRVKSRKLILSTPLRYADMGPDPNPQHYWQWDKAAVREMLTSAGWDPVFYSETSRQPGYIFQIWGCK